MKRLIILTTLFMLGCSSDRVRVQPLAIDGQTVTYARGAPSLQSQSPLTLKLAVLDYSKDEMIINLSVSNTTLKPVTFSEKNIEVELLAAEASQSAVVYSFEQLAKEAAEKGDDTLALAGSTAAGIGAGFIPFGGIAVSVGRLFYSVSDNSEGHQKRIDAFTYSQLNQNYFRQQTVEPGSSYSGFLKVGFAKELEEADTLTFRVFAGDEFEAFKFTCHEAIPSED